MSDHQITEEWGAVPRFSDSDVSNLGRIRSYKYAHRSQQGKRRDIPIVLRGGSVGEYRGFILCGPNGRLHRRVHQLVLDVFVGPCPPGMVARHLNDRLTNLRWGTESQNRQDALRNGRCKVGTAHPNSKLTERDVRAIRLLAGTLGRRRIAQLFGIGTGTVVRIIRGDDWKHVPGAHGPNAPRSKEEGRPRILNEREDLMVSKLYETMTQDAIAKLIGVTQATVSNSLRISGNRNHKETARKGQ